MRRAVLIGAAVIVAVGVARPDVALQLADHGRNVVAGITSAFTTTTTTTTTYTDPLTPTPSAVAPDKVVPHTSPTSGAKNYKFTVKDGKGRPGRWNPCTTIPIIVNMAHAPKGAMTDLKSAVAAIDAASGLKFKIVATTKVKPQESWGTTRWSGSGGKWPPVLMGFVNTGQAGLDDPGAGAQASPVWIESGSNQVFVSGMIVFNRNLMQDYAPGFGTGNRLGSIALHELGHIAGLDHVSDKHQIMEPYGGTFGVLGPGDKNGLHKLGSGGCLATPATPW